MLIWRTQIINPDAMIPMTYFESSSIILALGAIPMVLASIPMVRIFNGKKRIFILLPGLVTVGNFLYWIIVLAVGISKIG